MTFNFKSSLMINSREVGDLYELFSRPNYQETQLARTVPDVHDVSDPKCQMESSLYIRTRHFVEKIVEKYELASPSRKKIQFMLLLR
jgi:hypothetical protein